MIVRCVQHLRLVFTPLAALGALIASAFAEECVPETLPDSLGGIPLVAERQLDAGIAGVYVRGSEWLWFTVERRYQPEWEGNPDLWEQFWTWLDPEGHDPHACPYPCPLWDYIPDDAEFGLVDPTKWERAMIADGDTFTVERFASVERLDDGSPTQTLMNAWFVENIGECDFRLRYAVVHDEADGESVELPIFEIWDALLPSSTTD